MKTEKWLSRHSEPVFELWIQKGSSQQEVFVAPMCASRKYVPFSIIGSNAWNKGGGEREREIVVFFPVEKYDPEAKFLVFQYSTKDLNENKDEDDSIYLSAIFRGFKTVFIMYSVHWQES